MRSSDAIEAALVILQRPRMARLALRSPLPRGVTFLLEVAAGDVEALIEASARTGRSQAALRTAAGFFIEQVLLDREGDSYRVLGAGKDSPTAELRRHMALIMRWLHPDVVPAGATRIRFDRSLYINRVTGAWETVKTEERRAAYDASLAVAKSQKTPSPPADGKRNPGSKGTASDAGATRIGNTRGAKSLMLHRIESEGLLDRIMVFLRGRP